MKRIAALLLAGLACLGPAASAPVPSEVPLTWELDFQHQTPQPIQVRLPGDEKPTTFWYMLYTVSNGTDRDRVYMPQFVMYTDTGMLVPADRNVPGLVFHAIKERHNNPLLTDMTGMTGKLLQGSDNAKDGVAIWPDIDPKAGGFDVFVGGLSGEAVTLKLPKPVVVTEMGDDGKPREVSKTAITLHKTRRLRFKLPGEAEGRTYGKAVEVEKDWVMR